MSKRTEMIAVVVGFACLAIATTYPLVLGLATHLPSDLGDPVLTAWTLAWDASRAPHGFAGVWDAPNFFPYRHTLAYSDHLLGLAIFTAPLQAITGNPVLVYNLAFLGSVILSGSGMYVLARSLAGRRDAALVAAVVFACLPFRASHMAHLQWLMVGWLPIGLWALHRYFATGLWRHLAQAAGCFWLQAMTATYFLYFALLPFGVVIAVEIARRRPPFSRLARHGLPILILLAATIAPVARAYYLVRRDDGLRRTTREIALQSADVADYVQAAPRLRVWGRLGTTGGEHELFPGALALTLAGVAIIAKRRSTAVRLYAVILALAFVLSLGASPTAWGHSLHVPGPYGWLLAIVPGLDGVRAVARLGLIVALALAVLAAFGAAWLLARVAERWRLPALAAITAGVIAEGWAVPISTPAFTAIAGPGEEEAYEYLRRSPPGGVLELPATLDRIERDFRYQFLTLLHGHRIVNGHSGYVTPLYTFLAGGPSPLNETNRLSDAVEALRAVGVSYLVVHHDAFEDESMAAAWQTAAAAHPTQFLSSRRFGGTTIAALRPASDAPHPIEGRQIPLAAIRARASHSGDRLPFLFDGDSDTRWLSGLPQHGDEWVALELDRPRDISAIHIRMATRSAGDYPRELAVDAVSDTGTRTLFHGSVLPAFTRGILASGSYPDIDLALPSNQTAVLRLRQLGTAGRFFWSIHELQLWER
jgi:hypothetical protein